MGREIKRVALDFDWPLGEVWKGFVNPYYDERVTCLVCDGDYYSPAGRILNSLWYRRIYDTHAIALAISAGGIPDEMRDWAYVRLASPRPWCDDIDADDVQALIDADRLWDFTRVPRTEKQREIVRAKIANGGNIWLPESNGYVPTPDEVNAWNRRGMGHDSINAWAVQKARAARYGVDPYCPACNGEGVIPNPELQARIDAWKETEPPAGEGWQMWETVSEGSPVTPVFPTADGLIDHLVKQEGYSPQAARAFVEHGWAPSLVGVSGVGLWDGITAAGIFAAKQREHQED